MDQARSISDPEMSQLVVEVAKRYFDADLKPSEPFVGTLGVIILCYLIFVVTAILGFLFLPTYAAVSADISCVIVLALLLGVTLRVSGYIEEATLIGIFKEGLRRLALISRKPDS